MKNLFFFDAMLTPKIITLVYWLLLLASVISGVGYMFAGYAGFTLSQFFLGLLLIAGGAVSARIWCELLIVLFKINGNLQQLSNDRAAGE